MKHLSGGREGENNVSAAAMRKEGRKRKDSGVGLEEEGAREGGKKA